MVGKNADLDVRGPASSIRSHYLPAMQFLAEFVSYLGLGLPLCKNGDIVLPPNVQVRI